MGLAVSDGDVPKCGVPTAYEGGSAGVCRRRLQIDAQAEVKGLARAGGGGLRAMGSAILPTDQCV